MSPNRDHSTAPTAEGRPHVVTSGALPSPEAAEAHATLSQIWGAGQLDTAGGGEPPDQGLCPGEHESQGITWFCKKLLRSPLSLVSAPEEQPPRPETAGGLLERRRHLREFSEPARCQQGGHCPPLPRTGQTAYLQGEEIESPMPDLLFGVWPEPAGITCTPQ